MDEHGQSTPGPESAPPHAGLRYALLRVLLMLVVGGLLYLFGMRTWPWLFATVLVSAILSFFVLARQREAAARALEASVRARAARHETSPLPYPGELSTSAEASSDDSDTRPVAEDQRPDRPAHQAQTGEV